MMTAHGACARYCCCWHYCRTLRSLIAVWLGAAALISRHTVHGFSVVIPSTTGRFWPRTTTTRRNIVSPLPPASKNMSSELRQRNPLRLKQTDETQSPQETTTTTANKKNASVERPDPSILVAAKDGTSQQLAIAAIAGALVVGTILVVNVLTGIEAVLPDGWYAAWRDYTWPVPLGAMFMAAGIAHFALADTFTAMVPPVGTWGGLWQIPAPGADQIGLSFAQYHTYWSGVAEFGGGALLVAAGLGGIVPVQLPAFLLLCLVAAVTPANIYMYTHDVQVPRLPPIPYPDGHYARAAMQCVLLGIFWKLAFQ